MLNNMDTSVTIIKNKALAEERAERYGWSLFASMPSAKGLHYVDVNGVNIIVYLESDEFELSANVPRSIFELTLGRAGSFTNEKHFTGLYTQITNMNQVIRSSGMEETWWGKA